MELRHIPVQRTEHVTQPRAKPSSTRRVSEAPKFMFCDVDKARQSQTKLTLGQPLVHLFATHMQMISDLKYRP